AAALDQGVAVGDVPQYPAFDGRQPGNFGLGRSRRRWRGRRRGCNLLRYRARDFLRGRRRGGSRRRGRLGGAELVDGLAELGEFRGRFGLRLLDLVEAVTGLVELA